jgi:signal transduction histidine kinase
MGNTGQQDTFAHSDTKNRFSTDDVKETILVIDDELGPRESLRMLFKDDYHVITVENGDEGIAALKENNPDVVILDLKMPGKNGIETFEDIRDIDEKVPVIILTGYGDMDAAKKAIHLGALEFINKPFDIKEMRSIVREACEKISIEKRSERLIYQLNTLNNSLKERMEQLENMATIGQFSAEVIHEINNMLTVIYGYAQILMSEIDKGSLQNGNKKYISIIENEIKRCRNITKSVIELARTKMDKKDVNINSIIDKIVELFENSNIAKEVRFITEYDRSLPDIKADPNQIHQAIINVVLNSIQAIDSDGQIVIKTSINGTSLSVSIKDNGRGMTEETISRITEPYFTNNKKDGTGLGLSITNRVVKNHNGRIEIRSELSKGTEFIIYLPLTEV